jgi:hypothetical protein
MNKGKKFKLNETNIKELVLNMGYCMATDKITVEGLSIGYMYREEPEDINDSGWRFFSGTETQKYVDNPDNIGIYDVNTIANYDSAIIPYLNKQIGVELNRIEDTDDFK